MIIIQESPGENSNFEFVVKNSITITKTSFDLAKSLHKNVSKNVTKGTRERTKVFPFQLL